MEWKVFHYVQALEYTQVPERPFYTSCGFWALHGLRSILLKEVNAMHSLPATLEVEISATCCVYARLVLLQEMRFRVEDVPAFRRFACLQLVSMRPPPPPREPTVLEELELQASASLKRTREDEGEGCVRRPSSPSPLSTLFPAH